MDKFPFAVSLRCKAMWKQEVDLKRYNAWNRKLFRSSTSNRLNHLAAVHHQTGLSMQMMTAKLVLMANPVCHFLLQEEKSIISFGCDWSEQNTVYGFIYKISSVLYAPSLVYNASSVSDEVAILTGQIMESPVNHPH